ncbi:hypothetical protein BT69DRAFT_1350793 [Atractiella rhizophila]|nr:hypothetical protein BT69DRAFT_1350793 [Atractiella rhizophila]
MARPKNVRARRALETTLLTWVLKYCPLVEFDGSYQDKDLIKVLISVVQFSTQECRRENPSLDITTLYEKMADVHFTMKPFGLKRQPTQPTATSTAKPPKKSKKKKKVAAPPSTLEMLPNELLFNVFSEAIALIDDVQPPPPKVKRRRHRSYYYYEDDSEDSKSDGEEVQKRTPSRLNLLLLSRRIYPVVLELLSKNPGAIRGAGHDLSRFLQSTYPSSPVRHLRIAFQNLCGVPLSSSLSRIKLLLLCPNLAKITLHTSLDWVWGYMRKALETLKGVKTLEINDGHFSKPEARGALSPASIPKFLRCLPSIVTLDLGRSWETQDENLSPSKWKEAKGWDLDEVRDSEDENALVEFRRLSLPNLRYLYCFPNTPASARRLLAFVPQIPPLIELDLDLDIFYCPYLKNLQKATKESLQRLTIRCKSNDLSTAYLWKYLSQFNNLRYLLLAALYLQPDEEQKAAMPSLEYLRFDNCTYVNFSHLAELIKTNAFPKLRHLVVYKSPPPVIDESKLSILNRMDLEFYRYRQDPDVQPFSGQSIDAQSSLRQVVSSSSLVLEVSGYEIREPPIGEKEPGDSKSRRSREKWFDCDEESPEEKKRRKEQQTQESESAAPRQDLSATGQLEDVHHRTRTETLPDPGGNAVTV